MKINLLFSTMLCMTWAVFTPQTGLAEQAMNSSTEAVIKTPVNHGLPRDAQTTFTLAVAAYRQGDHQAAITSLQQILQSHADFHEARKFLIFLLLKTGNAEDAVKQLQAGAKLSGWDYKLNKLHARLLADQGQLNTAIDLLQSRQTDLKSDPDHYALLAGLHQLNGDHEQAMELYQSLLLLQPRNAAWLIGLAMSLEAKGDFVGAAGAYRKAHAQPINNDQIKSFVNARLSTLANTGP